MKKLIFLFFIFPTVVFAQSARDINIVIQKTLDLEVLKNYYNGEEVAGTAPLIIINDEKIPDNLIVFKFNKRVKIMTTQEIETFKSIYKGSLDSFFVFEGMDFTEDEVKIKAIFRKDQKIVINAHMKKVDKDWKIISSIAN